MKANAPEKIYITPNIDRKWQLEAIDNESVEYTRTDAFIENAEKYLKNQFVNDVSVLAGGVFYINFSTAIEKFLNYMKGE